MKTWCHFHLPVPIQIRGPVQEMVISSFLVLGAVWTFFWEIIYRLLYPSFLYPFSSFKKENSKYERTVEAHVPQLVTNGRIGVICVT